MADALLSPAVGGAFWAGTATALGLAARKLRESIDDRTVPLMGVLGAFIFAAQMINFTIPGTGSSGHLGGGLILSIVLGPSAAFLVMASVLTVQGLFFADGGLLALGCNIWNLGVYPCFLAYPLIYRPIARGSSNQKKILLGSLIAAVLGLQLGSLSVVLQTALSGKAELPFEPFLLLMQPIHLAIGLVEGFVTAGVVNYVRSVRPEILQDAIEGRPMDRSIPIKKVIAAFLFAAVLVAGALSWFASTHPDGLEWSIERIHGRPDLPEPTDGVSQTFKRIQDRTSLMHQRDEISPARDEAEGTRPGEHGPTSNADRSVAGILGTAIVLSLIVIIGVGIRMARRKPGGLRRFEGPASRPPDASANRRIP